MGWREDVKFKIGRIGTLYLGEANGQLGTEITVTPTELNSLDQSGNLQSAEHGAGAIGTAFAPRTYRWSDRGHIITEIHVDLTGLGVVGTAAKDVIGLAAGGAAYIGRYVVATCGIVYKIEMMCVEAPGEGTATITQDIDLGADDQSLEYDGACDDIIVNTATLVAGEVVTNDVPALTANDYIYLIEGDTAATTGVYNAGQYIVRMHGHAVIT